VSLEKTNMTRGTGSEVQGGAYALPGDFDIIYFLVFNNLLNKTKSI
jgi:hypothetical protein